MSKQWLNLLVFVIHGTGYAVISALLHNSRFVTGFTAFISGVAWAFALATYLDIRGRQPTADKQNTNCIDVGFRDASGRPVPATLPSHIECGRCHLPFTSFKECYEHAKDCGE